MQNKENHENNLNDILNEPIAIVGVNCQFPGVNADIEDIDAFHKMLLKQQTPIKRVPANRWDIDKYYDAVRQKEGKVVSCKGGFLQDPKLFDAAFFKITPIEAKQMDPQHRLFLEVSIRALNHANITLDSLRDSNTAVYSGISTHDYNQLSCKDHTNCNAYTYIGSADSAAAGRLSYCLNLKGPCVTVDTACSSSLSALYLATNALRDQQCDIAIVGGVHLSLCPESFIGVSKANMLSALGQSRSFDAKADGYVRSEGCGVVVVKRLRDAIRDNNTIHAVIKSIVMNQDGGGMGMAAPNIEAQIAMHQSVLEQANLKAGDIDYIETHGTGTIVGDSVEFNAIQSIHQGHYSNDKPLIIGALKSNLGHTISSSGIASLIKVIAAFKNEVIPANLHYSTPSKLINPNSIPALIPVKATAFKKHQNKKRHAQVSNFGFTGTNVSAVIEEPPRVVLTELIPDHSHPVCFVISANSEYSLKQMLISHQHYLETSPASLHNVCYTLINCRDHYKFRCAIIVKDKETLIKKIESEAYQIIKVTLEKDIRITGIDAKQSSEWFLSGANIRSDKNIVHYHPVDLPLYCFERKSYWHDNEKPKETKVPEDWYFTLDWQHQPFDENSYNSTIKFLNLTNKNAAGRRCKQSSPQWLLIGAKSLASSLKQQGLSIVLEEDNVSFNNVTGIIFAEGFNSPFSIDIDDRVNAQKNTLKKLLALIKELQHKTLVLQLIVLTTNATAELAKDKLNLDSSTLVGFCKTLVLELPHYKTMLIDLDESDARNFSTQVVNEILHNHGRGYEHVIAYRDGKRLVPRLKKTTLYHKQRSQDLAGRYLITGGCGGLGLVTAEALLSAGAKELILVSRTADKSSLKARLKKIQSDYPNRVIRTVSLDITNKVCLQSLLLESNADGLLKGIIHAAGASINAPLLEHQDEDIDHLFSAKVRGGWYLHELSLNCSLDYFIVYSSVSSVFGSNKESVYSATNSFLDALIAERQRLGLVGTVVQWGPWAEAGLAEKRSRDQGLKQALIHNEQGKTWIQRLISGQSTSVTIISPDYLTFMLDFVPKPMPAFYKCLADDLRLIEHPSDVGVSPWLSDFLKLEDNKKLSACKDMLSVTCKEILGIPTTDDMDEDEGFFAIGLDSLMMTELATRLKQKLQPFVNVVATIAFDYPSINKLSRYIESELKNHFIKVPTSEPANDSIAIIGMSCSLPNAPDIAAFELLLENGLSGIKDIPIERWDNSLYYDPNMEAPGKSYVNKLGLIENIHYFDPQFFGISPREAPFLEPQQRLFLENCYKALEHANYPAQSLRDSLTGVFAGVGSSHEYYSQLEKVGLSDDELGMYSVTGKALNIIPGRVAYTFDFKGPALSIDTACSSSLVAIHYACQSLKNREIDVALAGGVNVLLRPESIVNLCKAKALSPESQCKTFDENADGYVRAEGCGVLCLKRTADAIRDNDNILAVIKGSAINNDGKSAGLTVPNGKSQEEVMRRALSQTGLSSRDIGYIEAHGTGTPLGDPIEVHAINKVYANQREKDNPLYIGAVKTNIGHLESAAGVASMIKAILSLQNKRIYKNINFHQLNPKINIEDTRIALHTMDWHTHKAPNCIGVNAFGFSGTNAHIILQEFPANTKPREALPSKTNLLILSAKTETALNHLVKRYQDFLRTTQCNFNDICFTAATCRDHYTYRLAVVAKSAIEASQLLEKGQFASSHGKNGSSHNRGFNVSELACEIHEASTGIGSQNPAVRPRDVGRPNLPDDCDQIQTNTILDLLDDMEFKILATDYLQGIPVDWISYYKTYHDKLIKVALPNYTFVRSEFCLLERGDKNSVSSDSLEKMPGFESALQHLYIMQWHIRHLNLPSAVKLPDLWVIAKDKIRAKRALGHVSYQFIEDVDTLDNIAHKNILFFYEQEQLNDLLHCCQRLFKFPPASFILVTENAYAIQENSYEKVAPAHTMANAFWKSFKNELELNKNYTIDIDSNSTLRATLEYIFNTTTGETQFAIRDSIYVPRLAKKQLPINFMPQQSLFDGEASYLITGGTGGLAKLLIEYLICRGVKHIIITSRSECSVDTQVLIENARKQQIFIRHYAIDASNFDKMKHIIEVIGQSSKPLKGVFHLAGVLHDDLIVNLGDEALQQVLSAKMESALILHQLTKDISLDLFVLFSSAASILGSRGQSNYVAANGFLDGLAHLRQQLDLPALAINWGAFLGVGMAEKNIASMQRRGLIPLGKESIDVLDVLLPSQLPQILLCPTHWDIYFKNTPKQIELSDQASHTSPPDQHFLAFLRQHSEKERLTILCRVLREITADVLRIDDIEQLDIKGDLFALGMDSLTSLELRNRIHDKLQCPAIGLPIEYFINEPRIDKIAKNITHELRVVFAQASDHFQAEHSAAEAITLCDTQYVFWMLKKLGNSFNCGMQLQLHGKLNTEYLSQALSFAIHQQDVFWLDISEDAPVQRLKRQGQFKLIYKDISSTYDKNTFNDVFCKNVMRAIPLSEQPLIRVYLYQLTHELHELHTIIPHIILDDSSYRILFAQFKKNYETLLLGNKLEFVAEEYTYLDYVKQNNIHYEKDLSDKVEFWRVYNKNFKRLRFYRAYHLPDAAKQRKNLFHYPMDAQLVEQFKDWHKQRNINVSTGLIAACQIVFYKLSCQKKIPIMILHSGREGSRYKSTVGLFTEYKRLNISLNEGYTCIDFLKSIEAQLLITAPYQKCSQYIKNTGLKDERLSVGQYVTYQYNKLFLSKRSKESNLHFMIRDCYLKHLSMQKWHQTKVIIKHKLNHLLKLNLPLLKPNRLRVLINITSSFFIKEPRDMNFAGLNLSIPHHYASVDRPIGNQTLWLYFTKDQYNEYQLLINGPLTEYCKDAIARELNNVMGKVLENEECKIVDLV